MKKRSSLLGIKLMKRCSIVAQSLISEPRFVQISKQAIVQSMGRKARKQSASRITLKRSADARQWICSPVVSCTGTLLALIGTRSLAAFTVMSVCLPMAGMRFRTTLQNIRQHCATAAIAEAQGFVASLMERMISELKPCSAILTWHSFHPAEGQWAPLWVMSGSVMERCQDRPHVFPRASRKSDSVHLIQPLPSAAGERHAVLHIHGMRFAHRFLPRRRSSCLVIVSTPIFSQRNSRRCGAPSARSTTGRHVHTRIPTRMLEESHQLGMV